MSAARALQKNYYEALRRLTLQLSGMHLQADQDYFIDTRLKAIARREGFDNHETMVEDLFARGESRLAAQVVSALLERDTCFLHDRQMFEAFNLAALPRLYQIHKDQPIRIFNAACGAGHETWSLAMCVDQAAKNAPGLSADILGADYPSRALERAGQGRYSHFEVQRGLPVRWLVEYFERQGDEWRIKNSLKSRVSFEEYHLLSDPKTLGDFHVVYCRDALPRFAESSRQKALAAIAKTVKPGGYLILGPDEIVDTAAHDLAPIISSPGLYQKSSE